MALAYQVVKRAVTGGVRTNVVEITLDDSYAADGYALDLAQLGLETEVHFLAGDFTADDAFLARYIPDGSGALMILDDDLAEVSDNEPAIENLVVRCLVIGDGPTG